jgi:hypothetical protein
MFFNVFSIIPPGSTTWNPLEKGVIEKLANLVEFWLILER